MKYGLILKVNLTMVLLQISRVTIVTEFYSAPETPSKAIHYLSVFSEDLDLSPFDVLICSLGTYCFFSSDFT